MLSRRSLYVATFSILVAACSGGTTDSTSSSSGSSGPSGSGSGSTSGIGGVWDVNAFNDLADGKMGEITIANGEIKGFIPLEISKTDGTPSCHRIESGIRFAIAAAGNAASGTISKEEKFEGATCSESKKAGQLVTEVVASISGKRTTTSVASLTDLNGVWELTISSEKSSALTLELKIDGGTFDGHKKNSESKRITGSIVGNRATAAGDGFEFAAQRR